MNGLKRIIKSQHISDLLLGSKHVYKALLFRLCLCNTPMTLGILTRQFHVRTWHRTIHYNHSTSPDGQSAAAKLLRIYTATETGDDDDAYIDGKH